MHDDDSTFDDFLRREAPGYRAGTPAPAETMWAAIQQDVAQAISPPATRLQPRRSWMPLYAAIAATLVIGVAVGRWSTTNAPSPAANGTTMAAAPAPRGDSARNDAYEQAATIQHLAEVDVFLTSVRADLKADRRDADRAERSRELLARTRLLMSSDARQSPAVERLLQDLELLLAEIAATPASHNSMDTKILDETIRHGNVIPRIRATLPASTST